MWFVPGRIDGGVVPAVHIGPFRFTTQKEKTMLNRVLPFLLMALAVTIFAVLPAMALAQEKGQTHEGKIVKITKDELVMTGTDGKEHTHKLTAATKLRLDN